MTTEATNQTEIFYEGPGADEHVFAAVQANFLARRPTGAGTEIAVFINHPALQALADALSSENSPEFREEMARVVGRAWIEHRYRQMGRFEGVLVVSRGTLEAHPELVKAAQESQANQG